MLTPLLLFCSPHVLLDNAATTMSLLLLSCFRPNGLIYIPDTPTTLILICFASLWLCSLLSFLSQLSWFCFPYAPLFALLLFVNHSALCSALYHDAIRSALLCSLWCSCQFLPSPMPLMLIVLLATTVDLFLLLLPISCFPDQELLVFLLPRWC
jgi:hypothetical protein